MTNQWIIEVLGDLRRFAADNGLPRLADQLDDARTVAVVELAQPAPAPGAERHGAEAGRHVGGAG